MCFLACLVPGLAAVAQTKPTAAAKRPTPAKPDYITHSDTLTIADSNPAKCLILNLSRPWVEGSYDENALVAQCLPTPQGLHFFVGAPGQRVIWDIPLGNEPLISQYPILVLQYRAKGLRSSGEYGLWFDEGAGPSLGGLVAVPANQFNADGEFHELRVDIRKIPRGKSSFGNKYRFFRMGLRGAEPNAYCDIKQLRIEKDPVENQQDVSYASTYTDVKVTDSQGKPLVGIDIDVWNDWQNLTRHYKTNDKGVVTTDQSTPLNTELNDWAYSEKIVPRAKDFIPVELSLPSKRGDKPSMSFMMLRSTSFSGRVVDTHGKPVAIARVVLNAVSYPGRVYPDRWTTIAITDENGQFQTPPVPAEPGPGETIQYIVRVHHPDYASGPLTDNSGNRLTFTAEDIATSSVPLVMRKGLMVHGVITGPDGKPVSGAHVTVPTSILDKNAHLYRIPTVTTGKDGAFSTGPFGPGTHTLCITHPRYVPSFTKITGSTTQDQLKLPITLQSGVPIKARLLDEFNKPVDATVTITTYKGLKVPLYDARFDKTGLLTWNNPPQEPVRLEVRILRPGQAPPLHTVLLAPSQEEYALRYSPDKGGFHITPEPTLFPQVPVLAPELPALTPDPACRLRILTSGIWVHYWRYNVWPFIQGVSWDNNQLTISSQGVMESYHTSPLSQPIDTAVYPIVVVRYKGRLTKIGKPLNQPGKARFSILGLIELVENKEGFWNRDQRDALKQAAWATDEVILDDKERELRIDTRLVGGLTGRQNALGVYLDAVGIPDDIGIDLKVSQIWFERTAGPLNLDKKNRHITVQAVDLEGNPMPDVGLTLNAAFEGLTTTAKTSSSGVAAFTLPDAPTMDHAVSVEDPRYQSISMPIPQSASTVRIPVAARHRFAVRAVDPSGKPVAHAYIIALLEMNEPITGWRARPIAGLTDAQGLFSEEVKGTPVGISWLAGWSANGLLGSGAPAIQDSAYFGAHLDNVPSLTLQKAQTLNVTVNTADGKPLPFARVTINTDYWATGSTSRQTNAQGRCTFENSFRPDANIVFKVVTPGCAPVYKILPPAARQSDVVNTTITLAPGSATLKGTVIAQEGKPVVNKIVAVKAGPGADLTPLERTGIPMGLRDYTTLWTGKTDANGTFEAAGLPAGLVMVSHGDAFNDDLTYGPGRRETPIVLEPGVQEHVFEYIGNRPLQITGRDKTTGKLLPYIYFRKENVFEYPQHERLRLIRWGSLTLRLNEKTFMPAQHDVILVIDAGVEYQTIERLIKAGTTPVTLDVELERKP